MSFQPSKDEDEITPPERPPSPPLHTTFAVRGIHVRNPIPFLRIQADLALDMTSKLDVFPSDRPPVVFLDTLYHFPETYELVKEVEK
jgi:hypothetical protein